MNIYPSLLYNVIYHCYRDIHPETTVGLVWDFHIIATIEWQIGLVV